MSKYQGPHDPEGGSPEEPDKLHADAAAMMGPDTRSDIQALRQSMEDGKYEWKKNDPNVPADVLKHFLRELMVCVC